ncbi:UDP-N-acetylmuramyl pentapeptide phosphotransferase/UDP-N-acetylglucosamine-1-phosphate transferase [Microvirga lupini]|uniref:UDP-N-acetylmuramyl pentapeptide phosphotransferase/UDP-N-acetylglucosamine-1-phosphate transferase n=1 Tax=Microvirga lupini TaxID=420324 RepID=A0A7W4VPU6_9HYPH|nr:glycosyltransferase family 4 protein [Microvirga lupini]MBB3021138.1 UDP-N-acetylmuramyl pentapeptide phosphotransferase/UDP-N-acetylglucosamine-1-phosphate transferase [Microvirga lupini]
MEERPILLLMGLSVALLGGAVVSAFLILLLKPLLIRYALARPNARSSHKIPTPQGGGIAVIGACFLVGILFFAVDASIQLQVLSLSVSGLAIVGALDDIRPLPAIVRLVLQIVAVAAVILVNETRVFPEWLPIGVEQIFLILGGVWFVNLVNFMDGLDWITVAEIVPVTAFIALIPFLGFLPTDATVIAALLCGALLGFAPFNKPVAKLFLGDVGSLPIGLLVGWMLLQLAGTGALAAAILLPLYYLMDATITLLRRLRRGEKVWEAHRSHFYQKATDNGFSALQVSAHVFGLNLVLAGLAAMTLIWPSGAVQIAALVLGAALVVLILRRFSTPRQTIPLEVSR